jgi:hypothetical protein
LKSLLSVSKDQAIGLGSMKEQHHGRDVQWGSRDHHKNGDHGGLDGDDQCKPPKEK